MQVLRCLSSCYLFRQTDVISFEMHMSFIEMLNCEKKYPLESVKPWCLPIAVIGQTPRALLKLVKKK